MSVRFVLNMQPLKYVSAFCFGVWVGMCGYHYTTWQYWVLASTFALVANI